MYFIFSNSITAVKVNLLENNSFHPNNLLIFHFIVML